MDEVKVAIIIPPRNFRDETVSLLGLLLAKKDMAKVVASVNSKDCLGAHGAVVKPDATFAELDPVRMSAIILADGSGVDSFRLYEYRPLLDIVKAFHENNKLVVGIGNGIKIAAKANVLREAKVANTEKETESLVTLYRGVPAKANLVLDKNVLTLSDSSKIDELVMRLAEALGTA
jgi:putative intracellular protease/amidase